VSIWWRSDFFVGDALLDAQHRQLLRLCASAELLNEVCVDAQVHFATEEELLKRWEWPDLRLKHILGEDMKFAPYFAHQAGAA